MESFRPTPILSLYLGPLRYNILVLTANYHNDLVSPILNGLDIWPSLSKSLLCNQKFKSKHPFILTFGNLVHQTIEDIHKMILNGRLGDMTNEIIRDELFESNYRSLISIGMRPISEQQKNVALDHTLDYFNQNYDNLHSVADTELEISIEKPGYILTGKIDLLLEENGKFEIIDFKTEQKPKEGDPLLKRYFKQL
jgi:PD-(D/E)XK nuclease superfamily